jgi:hypothetical protein
VFAKCCAGVGNRSQPFAAVRVRSLWRQGPDHRGGDTGAALGCQLAQHNGTPREARILSAASVRGARAAQELLAGLGDTAGLSTRMLKTKSNTFRICDA